MCVNMTHVKLVDKQHQVSQRIIMYFFNLKYFTKEFNFGTRRLSNSFQQHNTFHTSQHYHLSILYTNKFRSTKFHNPTIFNSHSHFFFFDLLDLMFVSIRSYNNFWFKCDFQLVELFNDTFKI